MPRHDIIDDNARFIKLEMNKARRTSPHAVWTKPHMYLTCLFNFPAAYIPYFDAEERVAYLRLKANFEEWLRKSGASG